MCSTGERVVDSKGVVFTVMGKSTLSRSLLRPENVRFLFEEVPVVRGRLAPTDGAGSVARAHTDGRRLAGLVQRQGVPLSF